MQFPCQKNFLEKNGSKLAQRSQANAHEDVRKINNWKWFLGPIGDLYAPKEFSKVNACVRDPPWCNKITQFSRQPRSVTHTNPEWCVLTVFSTVPCSFDLQTTVSYYNFKFDKNLIHAAARTSLYGSDLIHESLYSLLHFSSQQRNNFFYLL